MYTHYFVKSVIIMIITYNGNLKNFVHIYQLNFITYLLSKYSFYC